MKNKILKWFIPVISYFIFIGLLFLWNEIDLLVFEVNKGGGPEFPPVMLIFLLFPLIPWGYFLLVITQYLYKKNVKWFKWFAWILTIASVILAWIEEVRSVIPPNLLYFLWTIFPIILFYYVPFFLILYYVFKNNHERGKL
jgi:hypothetical protein